MSALAGILGRWVEFCEQRPRQVLGLVGIISLGALYQVAAHFAIDSDLSKLIRPAAELGWYRANEAQKAYFPEQQQTSVVVVSGADPLAVDQTATRLRSSFAAEDRFEFVFAPSLNPFLRDHRAYFLDTEQLADWVSGVQYDFGAMLRLADSADMATAVFTLADQVSATDGLRLPSALRTLMENFSAGVPESLRLEIYPHLVPEADIHYLILIVKGVQNLRERLPNAAQVALIREIIGETEIDPTVRVRLSGEVPLAHEEISTALDGIGIAGGVSLLLLGLILYFGVGSWRIISATFALLGVGVLWTLSFALLTVGAFNTLALIFVVMFFGLGVDFSVHFSLRMRESMGVARDQGDGADVEVHAARDIGPALVLCMLTSSIAFLSFVPTAYLGLGELGIISAGGMVIALVLTLTLLPAFFSLFGIPLPTRNHPGGVLPETPGASGLASRPGLVLLLAGLVAVVSLWVAKDLEFDYSVLALRDENTEAMSTLLELQENGISTDYSISVLAADEVDAGTLAERLEALDSTGTVLTPASLVPAGQLEAARILSVLPPLLSTIDSVTAMPADDATAVLTDALAYFDEEVSTLSVSLAEADRDLVSGFIRGLHALEAKPDQLDKLNRAFHGALEAELADLKKVISADPFTFADLPAELRQRFVTADGQQLVTVLPATAIDSRPATDAFVRSVMSVTPDVGGRAVVEWGVGGVVVASFQQAVGIAVVAISILLMIYFRGVVLPVIVLIPLAMTTVITFALVELLGLTLNMANVLVVPLIFGLGVDTGIHVVHRFSAAGSVAAMMRSSTTRAVVISALTTIGTFFSLSFSPHKGAASVGLLLTIAISTMLVVTLLVVPALLRTLDSWSGGERRALS